MKKRPNILLITIDCLRADHVSCLGYEKKTTPNIDKLAEEGVLFTQAIANGPSTYSSFPSIFTSTYPLMHVAYPRLDKSRTTLFEVLEEDDYITAGLYNNPYLSPNYNYGKGFMYYGSGSFSNRIEINKVKDKDDNRKNNYIEVREKLKKLVSKNEKLESFLRGKKQKIDMFKNSLRNKVRNKIRDYKAPFVLPYTTADDISREANSWIEDNYDRDFALWVHFMDTHCPFSPPSRFLKTNIYEINRVWTVYRKNPKKVSAKDMNRIIKLYDGVIKFIDYSVGEIIYNLKKLGIFKDTIIVITADHGDEFKEHGNFGHVTSLYEETIRIPLIIKLANSEEKTEIFEPVGLLDLSPTLLDIVNVSISNDFLGRSLIPRIDDRITSKERDNIVLSEFLVKDGKFTFNFNEGYYLVAARNARWKLIFSEETCKRELYDLENDPQESKNVYEKNKKIAAWLEQKIKEHIRMERKARKTSREKQKVKRVGKKIKKLF